jgi:hypothetical protein
MRWLMPWILLGLASAVSADSLRYLLQLRLPGRGRGELQRRAVDAGAGLARRCPQCRRGARRLSLAIGWLLGWAGEQTPIAADRGGNFADDGVYGRMDCIDHSTTTTRLLRLLESRRWLQFHRVLEPVRRVLYLFEFHYSAQIEELEACWRQNLLRLRSRRVMSSIAGFATTVSRRW